MKVAPFGKCWIDPANPLYKLSAGEYVVINGCRQYHSDEPFLVPKEAKSCFYNTANGAKASGFPTWSQRNTKEPLYTDIIVVEPDAMLAVDTPILPGGTLPARIGFKPICEDACFQADVKEIAEGAVKDGSAPMPRLDCLLLSKCEKQYFVRNCSDKPLKLAATPFCN